MKAAEHHNSEPIAIIGMGCRLPGATSPEELWQAVIDKRDCVADYPGGRSPELDSFYENAGVTNFAPSRRGGFLPDLDKFDASFFQISPREAQWTDPQQRLLLEVSWEAMEDAGILHDQIAGSDAGVFIGVWASDYERHSGANAPVMDFFHLAGGPLYGASSRISYQFDLRGPDVSVNAACASSLVAIHLAVRALRAGECSVAFAGGVNMIFRHELTQALGSANVLSKDGRCKFGDASADGFVRSEGIGILVCKRLSDAERDGDRILASIRGTAVTNNGQVTGSMSSPSKVGQRQAMLNALADGLVDAGSIEYVEAHGTGTRAGDPVELAAISSVYAKTAGRTSQVRVGSVKSNIGHTESTAGVASVIKTIQAFRNGLFPPTIHARELNPAVDWENGGVILERDGSLWEKNLGLPRRAGVNGLGLTGTNAHVVLEEAPQSQVQESQPKAAYLLPISAATSAALRQRAEDIANALKSMDKEEAARALSDFCFTAAVKRTHLAHRLAVVGENAGQIQGRLREFIAGEESQFVAAGVAEQEVKRKVAFVFPGQGSQWIGMGRQLLKTEPAFRLSIEACDREIQAETGWSLLEQLQEPAFEERLTRIDTIQPTLFGIEVAFAELWKSWGVTPSAVVGHSMGEVAAAHIAGVLTLTDAVRIICRRSVLLMRVAGSGAMVVVDLTRGEAERAIAGLEDRISIAVSNSPRSTVLAGDPKALDRLVEQLEEKEIFCRWVRVDVASHSPQMDPLKEELFGALSGLQPQTALIPLYSTVRGTLIEAQAGQQMDTGYWVDNLRETVQFATCIEMLFQEGFDTFLEMSPHPILMPFVDQTADHLGKRVLALGSVRREEPESAALLSSLARLYVNGFDIDWKLIYPSGNQVSLPSYPWQRERFWIESSNNRNALAVGSGHPLIGDPLRVATGEFIWSATLSSGVHLWLKDHGVDGSILLPASAFAEMAQSAAQLIYQTSSSNSFTSVEGLRIDQAISSNAEGLMQLQLIASPRPDGSFRLDYFHRQDAGSDWAKAAETSLLKVAESSVGSTSLDAWLDAEFSSGTVTGQQHSETFAKFGYEFGPSFRQLEWISLADDVALAVIRIPSSLRSKGYQMHPATLDAALQLLGYLLLDKNGIGSVILPIEFRRVEFFPFTEIGSELYARAVIDPGDALCGDVTIYDQLGRLRARVTGLKFKELAGAKDDQLDSLLYTMTWEKLPGLMAAKKVAPGSWLLVGGTNETASALGEALTQLGASAFVSNLADLLDGEQFVDDTVINSLRGVVLLTPMEIRLETSLAQVETLLFQAASLVNRLVEAFQGSSDAAAANVRLWTVTREAQAAFGEAIGNPLAASVWGLFASVSNEHPELHAGCIDLASESGIDESIEIAKLLLADPAEDRILLRPEAKYMARMSRGDIGNTNESSATSLVSLAIGEHPGSANSYELRQRTHGSIESFELRTSIHSGPTRSEVEISVEAGGLNFLDVLRAMGINDALSSSHFGGECAGTVLRVGEGVTSIRPGDEVIAISPSFQDTTLFASRVTIPAELVVRKPQSMNFAQGAGLPCVFLTAYYSLAKLAQVQRGEKILIHAAAGGVGLAAIQVAHWLGAEVYATVGSQQKRDYITSLGVKHIMDSRKLDFRDEVLAKTNGEGVDVVLNSLAGPAITAGLQSLAPYGRFIEIGKRDIWENSKIGLNPFLRNRSFFAVDLAKAVEDRRAMVGQLFTEVMDLFEQGIFQPLPVTTFPVSEAVDAFRTMAQGKHVGKIILSMKDPAAKVRVDGSQISSEATYLITGGLGGLGLVAAEALVAKGARQLVLVSRSAPSPEAESIISRLEVQGATIVIRALDISSTTQVDELFAEIRQSLPPLRGVIHAAGVLDDSLVRHLTLDKFRTVLAGKVGGAIAIDRNIKPDELDFLVYYASAAGVLGTPGQANYAAANTMLDALAHQQRARGIPAISIDWGSWADVGLAALHQNRGARLVSHGLTPLTPTEGARLLLHILAEMPIRVSAMRFDANAWCDSNPGALRSGIFTRILRGTDLPESGELDFAEQCRHMPHELLEETLIGWLQKQVASVLRCNIDRVVPDKALRSLGLDSLMALELRNRLERGLRLKLSATLAWNYPTILALATHLQTKLALKTPTPEAAITPAVSKAPVANREITSGKISQEVSMQPAEQKPQGCLSAAELLEAELLGVQSLLSK